MLMLVLAGIVVSTLFAALTTLLQYLADPERQLPALVFWLMGSFAAVTMSKLALALGQSSWVYGCSRPSRSA